MQADQIRKRLREIQSKGDPQEIAWAMEEFYRRADGTWRVKGLDYADRERISFNVHCGKDTFPVTYNAERNIWRCGGVASEVDIAEKLGVPVAYLNGVTDVLRSTYRAATAAKDMLDRVKEQHASVRAKRARLNCQTAYSKEVKKFKALTGQAAARAIARAKAEVAWAREQVATTPKSIKEIPGLARVAVNTKMSGIYFLVAGEEVVYVGQSVNVAGRVGSHTKDKDFDAAFAFDCPKGEMDDQERMWIDTLQPKYNQDAGVKRLRRERTLCGA